MSKIKILVACHKPCDVISNDVYMPIHVGRAVSKYKDEMAHMTGDDTGDNISEKNPYYSELTALYWAWKNLRDVEYIGLCHYRRFFGVDFTCDNIDSFFSDGTDVLMSASRFCMYNRWNYLKNFVSNDDLAILQMIVKKLYPDYYITMSRYANDYIDHAFNMLVCRFEVFDKYMKWLFDILFECEKYMKLKYSPYSRARRIYGYLSEFLMPVWFIHHGLRIKDVPCLNTETQQLICQINWRQRLTRIILKKIYFRYQNTPLEIERSIATGLKADGIDV